MASASAMRRRHADYTVACICPMSVELAPVEAMLDEIHESLPARRDQNAYTLGRIGGHYIVIAIMPSTGNNTAATVATQLLNEFPLIRFCLLVGIGGGVPGPEADIRLGDVVVSQPSHTFGGVVQYDLGKLLESGNFERTGSLNKPPSMLTSHVRKLDSRHRRQGNDLLLHLSEMLQKYPMMVDDYSFPSAERDQLFVTSYKHQVGATCDQCDGKQTVSRPDRKTTAPKIHYGTIGSANVVLKNAKVRDTLRDMHILCVEMEAAGLQNDFACLVIRGICDYADSHKNKKWQPYAAAVAAAYMKELLLTVPIREVASLSAMREKSVPRFRLGLHLTGAPVFEPELFIGRFSELEEVDEILRPSYLPQEHRCLVLGGIGGIGKSQLAIAYAMQRHDYYGFVFWLNAASEALLKHSIRLLAQQLSDAEKCQDMDDDQILLHVSHLLLDRTKTPWLLIFDNYDEPSTYNIRKYYPHDAHGSAIITTRLPDQVGGQILRVPPLNGIEQSLDVLETRSKRENVRTDVYAHHLAERMQGLPLALATAGAYLRNSTWTFKKYLEEYEKQGTISPHQPLQDHKYHQTLYKALDISYRHLEEEYIYAAQLLKLLAYFDNQQIWFELIHAAIATDTPPEVWQNEAPTSVHLHSSSTGQPNVESTNFFAKNSAPEWLLATVGDSFAFESAMRMLADYCFIQPTKQSQSYSMHTCVHDWTLAGPNRNVHPPSYWFAFDCVSGSIRNENLNFLGQIEYAPLVPHAIRLTHRNFDEIGQSITLDRLTELDCIAELLRQHGQYEAAEPMFLRILDETKKSVGPNHRSTLTAMTNLANLYRNQGKLDQAEKMLLRALDGWENSLPSDRHNMFTTMYFLAVLYHDQDKPDEVEQMLLRSTTGKEKILGRDHSSTLRTVEAMGDFYMQQDRLSDAELMFVRALSGYQSTLGDEHPNTHKMVDRLSELRRQRNQPRVRDC